MAKQQRSFEQKFSIQAIDQPNGVIHGVGMITVGPVLGHEDPVTGIPLVVDELTIQQVLAAAQTYQTGLKVKADHGSGVMAVIGYLSDFYIDNSGPATTLRADFHVLDSEPNKEKIFEMAATMPDCFGFSVSFIGEDEIVDNQICVRCDEIFSCDLVTEPAACPTGLFERRRVDAGAKGSMANSPIQSSPKAPAPNQSAPAAKASSDNADLPSLADLAAAHKQLMDAMKGHMARFAKLEAAVAALAPSTAPGAPLPSGDADKTNEPPNKAGVSGQAEDAPHLPFEAEADADADADAATAVPGQPEKFKHAAARKAELREMGMAIGKEIARQFSAKLGTAPAAAAAPGAPTDKADAGEKPKDKFIASVQKHYKATGSKGKALSLAVAECGNDAHRAFVNSQERIEFKRD